MAQLTITEKLIGDVIILTLSGKATIGEGSVQLRETVKRLIEEGKTKILLDIEDLTYVDSSGLGELVSTYTRINRAKGKVWLCRMNSRISDLLAITKLGIVYCVADTVEEALAYINSNALFVDCPISGWPTRIRYFANDNEQTLSCPNCAARLRLAPPELGGSRGLQARVLYIDIPTYEGEYVRVIPGTPNLIEVVGRLNLFASRGLKKAYDTSSYWRSVVFCLGKVTEFSQAGIDTLARLCRDKKYREGQNLISTEGLMPDQLSALPSDLPVYNSTEAAVAVLKAELSETEKPLMVHPRSF